MIDDTIAQEERAIARGERAVRILEDELVKGAFQTLRERYSNDWLSGESVDAREGAWHRRRVLDELEQELRNVVEAGQRASHRQEVRKRRQPQRPRPRH